jgi:ankyrin repeat protein
VRLLLRAGADARAADARGNTPQALAEAGGHAECAALLAPDGGVGVGGIGVGGGSAAGGGGAGLDAADGHLNVAAGDSASSAVAP